VSTSLDYIDERIEAEFNSLRTTMPLPLRTVYVGERVSERMSKHFFEIGKTSDPRAVAITIKLQSGRHATQGNVTVSPLISDSDMDNLFFEKLQSGNDTQIIRQVRRILAALFDQLSMKSDPRIVPGLMKHLFSNQSQSAHEEYMHGTSEFTPHVNSAFSVERLQTLIEQCNAKGAGITGFRFSPHGRIVISYARRKGEVYHISLRDAIEHIDAAYLISHKRISA